jgi:hypothetical protein
MKTQLLFIASRITDSSKPLQDRAALARWARTTAWHSQIERLVLAMAVCQAEGTRAALSQRN